MIDMRNEMEGGADLLIMNEGGVKVSIGDWTSVEIDGLQFWFDSDAFDWRSRKLSNLDFILVRNDERLQPSAIIADVAGALGIEYSLFLKIIRTFATMKSETYLKGIYVGKKEIRSEFISLLGL